MARKPNSQRGSAMTEAAIIFPCLVLIVYWSAALTDVMVLKLKAAEALRYALWENTVFKAPTQINTEVQQKFVDLRSPRDENVGYTGLLMYPLTRDMLWGAAVDSTNTKVSIGRDIKIPGGTGIEKFIYMLMGAIAGTVDGEMQRQRFNVHGKALARVTLIHARHDEQASPILKGGDLLGLKGGNDLDHDKLMTNFTFQAPLPSQRAMELVFDSWKAWPKPAAYTPDSGTPHDPSVSPMKTYPTVEDHVSHQVKQITFFGLTGQWWFQPVQTAGQFILGVLGPLAGGHLPDVFSTARMDNSNSRDRGPITILPPEPADVAWTPSQCDYRGSMETCSTSRLGDLRVSSPSPVSIDDYTTLGPNVDHTRYTLPYRINTVYWTQSGGTNNDDTPATSSQTTPYGPLATKNEYTDTYKCRGHYFAGSQRAQEPDFNNRYARSCYK